MRTALFGGRFDPPHKGHIAIARETLSVMPEIEQVLFLPDNTHPFDWKSMVASSEDRMAMLKLIEEDSIGVSTVGIERQGRTYAIDTVRYLQKNTKNEYIWICGSDQIKDFSKWKEYKVLEQLISFVVFPRKGYEQIEYIPKNFTLLHPIDFEITDISSTEIRKRIKDRMPISHLVSKKVIAYIKEKGLYR